MISYRTVSKFCKDDISLIENYEEAVNSEEIWDCHHRLETDLDMTRKDLIDKNMYFNRPASELIFLTRSEHQKLHKKVKTVWNKGLSKEMQPCYNKDPWNKGLKGMQKAWNKGLLAFNKGKHRVYHSDGKYHYEK